MVSSDLTGPAWPGRTGLHARTESLTIILQTENKKRLEIYIMATKSKNKKMIVKLYLITLTSCIVMAAVFTLLATPDTALAKKPGTDTTTYYSVTMTGDLTIAGGFGTPLCNLRLAFPGAWRKFQKNLSPVSGLPDELRINN